MADERPDNRPAGRPGPPSVDRVVTALRRRLASRDAQGRPFSVYGVLAIGVATLLILLLVVYFSASDRARSDQPICTTIEPEQAELAVRDGTARRLTIAYDDEVEIPTNRSWGPVLARLDYTSGQCANLPQGIANQRDVYAIVGVIDVYNETTENPRVEIIYDRASTLDDALFAMPSPTATATAVPTITPPPSPEPTITPAPTAEPTEPVVTPPTVAPVGPPVLAPTATLPPPTVPSGAPDGTPDLTR